MRAIALVTCLALAGCYSDDSTDIAGDYFGNLTYTATGNLAGASSADLVVTDEPTVALGDACTLDAGRLHQETILDNQNATKWVFTSDGVSAGEPCSAPIDGGIATFTVTEGTLIVQQGGTAQLQIGGNLAAPANGYIAYMFAGALR